MDLITAPFPHVIVDDFLDEAIAQAAFKALKSEPFTEKEADLFHFAQTADLKSAHQPILAQIRELFLEPSVMEDIEAAFAVALKREVLDGAGTFYKEGNFLLPHDDQLEGRAIAFLWYLSTVEGGDLALFDDIPCKVVKRISPQFNRLVLFEVSKVSYHAVEEVLKGSRLAIGGWYHGN